MLESKHSGRSASIVVVEDEPEMREMFRRMVELFGWRVVGEAGSGESALTVIRRTKPDVVLIDLCLPELPGVDVIEMIRQELPGIRFIAITGQSSPHYVDAALAAGATSYLLKPPNMDQIRTAIEEALLGHYYIAPAVAGHVVGVYVKAIRTTETVDLTRRQQEVTELVSKGLTSAEVSERLGISIRTVHRHRERAKERTGAKNSADLVRLVGAGRST